MRTGTALCAALLLAGCAAVQQSADPLPSWHSGDSRERITTFVASVTRPGADFVPVAERIAVFDNDGTLWSEQPLYFQLLFAMDRIRALAPEHPEWRDTEPFASVLRGDVQAALAGGEHALLTMLAATHSGLTTAEFRDVVLQWVADARHPTSGRAYTAMVYQPMLELLAFLRDNGFKTYIVSGGGQDFMRPWTEAVYGIPPEQVVGTHFGVSYEDGEGGPQLVKQDNLVHLDDGPGKPVGIHRFIGRRPLMAFGNSDGDFQMLEWTTAGEGPRLGVLIRHTDAEREWAYDRESSIGRLVRGLDEADERGWLIVDMAADWQTIYPN